MDVFAVSGKVPSPALLLYSISSLIEAPPSCHDEKSFYIQLPILTKNAYFRPRTRGCSRCIRKSILTKNQNLIVLQLAWFVAVWGSKRWKGFQKMKWPTFVIWAYMPIWHLSRKFRFYDHQRTTFRCIAFQVFHVRSSVCSRTFIFIRRSVRASSKDAVYHVDKTNILYSFFCWYNSYYVPTSRFCIALMEISNIGNWFPTCLWRKLS